MKALRIFTALLLLFILFNYFSRKLLPFAYADVADYSLLYTTDKSVYIKQLAVQKDSLDIWFNVPSGAKHTGSWHYTRPKSGTDSGTLYFTGYKLRYRPPAGKSQVLRINAGQRSYSINISYTPNSGSLPFEVTSADMLIEPAMVHEPADWSPVDWISDKRIKFGDVTRFVTDSAGIASTDSTVEKILKIGRLVLAGMPPDNGAPAGSTSALHPYDQYKAAKAGRANLWCGNYAAIFNCFAVAAGIPTRTVFTGTSKENLGLGNHVFCEAYIKEEDCWAYVDLTRNTVLLKRGDRFLNVIDLHRLLRFDGAIRDVTTYRVLGDSIQTVSFDSLEKNARYYFNRNTFFTFFYKDYFSKYQDAGLVQRIKNLFITRPMYAVYSDNLPGRNYHFLIRIFSNYLLVIAAIAWLASFVYYWYLRKYK